MSKFFHTVLFSMATLTLGMTACASVAGPPSDIENACSIRQERSEWYKEARAAAKKWNTPVPVMLAIIWRESRYQAEARTPRKYALGFVPWGRQSSAYGFAQAIDGTWKWYQKDQNAHSADRNDFGDAVDFVGWYMDRTRAKLGISPADARRQYLAYHEGHNGYRKGKWQQKAFLVKASNQVVDMAVRYDGQLRNCDPIYAKERALAQTPLPKNPPFALTKVAAVVPNLKPTGSKIIPASLRVLPKRKPLSEIPAEL